MWDLRGFDTLSRIPPENPNKPHERTRYPLRYLRYWFVRMLLEREAERLGRPLRVCEVGVDRGQMLAFMGGPSSGNGTFRLPAIILRWDAVDLHLKPDELSRYSYSNLYRHDLDSDDPLPVDRYDAVIFLHVLEHLLEPEKTLKRFLDVLEPGGLFLGGSPTMPDMLVNYWQRRLRANIGPNGHVSVITPARLRRFAHANGMSVEFLSGAYLMRNGGRSIENSSLWLRMNLLWGAMFPSLGSEVYFAMRKA
ncbi:MAG: class I SAM-dependent methyltransferase [Candidatus Korobacteraceae bacterium]